MATTTLGAVQSARSTTRADLDAELATLATATATLNGLLGTVEGYDDGAAVTAQTAIATSRATIERLEKRLGVLASYESTNSGGVCVVPD